MSTSTAIVLAGALIGLGLFFGLRGLAPSVVAPPAAPPSPSSLPIIDADVSRRHATDALAYHLETLRRSCYLPAVAGEPTPPTVGFELSYTFDPEGQQIMRGLVEVRGTERPEVTRCLTDTLPPLRIPRPGAVVTVTLPLSFP